MCISEIRGKINSEHIILGVPFVDTGSMFPSINPLQNLPRLQIDVPMHSPASHNALCTALRALMFFILIFKEYALKNDRYYHPYYDY